jgi:hypothetical protein
MPTPGMWRSAVAFASALLMVSPTYAQSNSDAKPAPEARTSVLDRMLAGRSEIEGEELAKKVEEASAHALGSERNPVRASMPSGQRAYLARLRCADGSKPDFARQGSFGVGVYGNIIDAYEVRCDGSEPASSRIFMDMYHRGYVEKAAVAGFTIVD